MTSDHDCDLAIIGGGLAGGLIALALATRRPGLRLMLVEAEERLGGNHIWSFFDSDIDEDDRWIVEPLICHRWPSYDVIFPGHRRTLDTAYNSIESERLDTMLRTRLGPESLLTGHRVADVQPNGATLEDGTRIATRALIDTRGTGDLSLLDLGWQKFVGRELQLARPHGLARPIVMDATVDQQDGYRFVYCLPFSADRLFIEDTYYSDNADLDGPTLGQRIEAYAAQHGWSIETMLREESGILPVAMSGDFEAYWRSGGDATAKAGMRAGLFHPTTGYSLPDAVRIAAFVTLLDDLSGNALHHALHGFARRAWAQRSFYRLLDRMLFRAAAPMERYKVLERFYRLDAGLIGRFYAARSTVLDRLRILAGKPPVPIGRALGAMMGKEA
ncbi:lycopene cyclase [Sphingomonas oleivorans]|uniref:Lycopene cyclase n=1 Tax=Sphingomonas oleivorans TaxID=1735121 RepID=A0A2T5G2P9_9SPHN|nr:lycopene beta-cyclase CrtY [Sphingomonas oleivorans]PTQ13410.1 lycopene cyclase [Sphingomonas oleivorans]